MASASTPKVDSGGVIPLAGGREKEKESKTGAIVLSSGETRAVKPGCWASMSPGKKIGLKTGITVGAVIAIILGVVIYQTNFFGAGYGWLNSVGNFFTQTVSPILHQAASAVKNWLDAASNLSNGAVLGISVGSAVVGGGVATAIINRRWFKSRIHEMREKIAEANAERARKALEGKKEAPAAAAAPSLEAVKAETKSEANLLDKLLACVRSKKVEHGPAVDPHLPQLYT